MLSGDIDNNDTVNASGVVSAPGGVQGASSTSVVTAGGVDSRAVLDGFVVTASASGGISNVGGSNARFTDVTISRNSASCGAGCAGRPVRTWPLDDKMFIFSRGALIN